MQLMTHNLYSAIRLGINFETKDQEWSVYDKESCVMMFKISFLVLHLDV